MNHLSGTLQWTGPTQCHKRKYSSVQHSTLPASTDTYPLTPIIPDTTMPKPQNAIRVVVVGAGLAGISTAIALKKQGRQDYKLTIIEKSDAVGGTWKASVYPGCGCDIAAHWYSLSTELNPDWSSHYVGQPELLAYWESLWRKYGLEKHAIFNTFVTSAEWDESAQLYHITTKNQYNGRIDRVDAEIVIFANGAFKRPLYPKDIRNLTDFQGDMFHSARWRDDISLQGKRVAVIGNGCTAAQLVPAIAKDRSTSVVNFARSAQWYIGQNNFNYHPIVKWIFSHVPGVLRAYRNIIMAGSDLLYLLHGDNPIMRRIARKIFVDYAKSVAPKEHWERLIPKHAVGCTRSIVDPGYLRCLSQENVDLRWDEIDRLVRSGIKTKSGQVIPFDVIIFATGYDVNIFESDVRGRNGRDLQEYFKEQGGLTAYLGMAMPDFPNLFTLLGPNVATSHASVVFSEETQINLVIELIKPILQHKATSFAIKEEVVDEYNTWLQKRLSGSVWADCSSYYHADRKKGKIIATFPGPVTLFWLLARTPKWHQWVGTNAEKWAEELVYETRKRYILTVIIVALSVVVWYFSL